jgi:hypothetical protein
VCLEHRERIREETDLVCHIPSVSIEISVMPFFVQTALTRAPPRRWAAMMTVPGTSGIWVA